MPSVSVIIPNYNRASLIGETLDSILAQTSKAHEIIVVDDGSTDQSRDVIRSFSPAVRLIEQKKAGPAAARNRGFVASSGDFIQFMDSDDLCAHNKIEEQLGALLHSGADIAYSPYVKCSLADGIARMSGPVMQYLPVPQKRSLSQYFAEGWGIYLQACLFRRSILAKSGPFNETLMPTEDYEFLFRILLEKPVTVHVASTCFVYRLHSEGQISFDSSLDVERAQDYINYVATVLHHIQRNRAEFRKSHSARWRIEAAYAKRSMSDIKGTTPNKNRLGRELRELTILCRYLSSLAWQLSRKFHGRVYRRSFGEGPLTKPIVQMVRELGYEIQTEAQLCPGSLAGRAA